MGNHILSIVVAFVAYSMLDLGKAFQKVGLSAMSRNRGRGMGIWFAGSAATSASSFLILYAVSLGSVLIVGSMAGTGLAAVTLLTVLMMKTPVKRHELAGVACIMAAPFLLASVYQEPPATRLVVEHLFYFLGAVLAVFTLLILIFRRSAKLLGILLAGSAGALGGFVILFQKISTSALGRAASLFSHLDASGSGPQVGHRLPVRLGFAAFLPPRRSDPPDSSVQRNLHSHSDPRRSVHLPGAPAPRTVGRGIPHSLRGHGTVVREERFRGRRVRCAVRAGSSDSPCLTKTGIGRKAGKKIATPCLSTLILVTANNRGPYENALRLGARCDGNNGHHRTDPNDPHHQGGFRL
jgi:hypothetical protein